MQVQIAAISFVSINARVDYFMTYLQNTFKFNSFQNLLRARIQSRQSLDFLPVVRGKLWPIDAGFPAIISHRLRLLGSPAALTCIARRNSREIVPLSTPTSAAICVAFKPAFNNPEIRYRCSWLSSF
jgi:hypothetical protein